MIYVDGAFYVFGGAPSSSVDTIIGKLDAETRVWSKAGDLNASRWGHNVIYDGRHFLVIGGKDTHMTEKCTLTNDGIMMCVDQNPKLTDYAWYPELFFVVDDFCKQ